MLYDNFFFIISLFFSLFMIRSKNPVHSILSLVVVFFACIMFLLEFDVDFLSLIILVIYVGAITILFLFIVMMLNVKLETKFSLFKRFFISGFFFMILFFFEFFYNMGLSDYYGYYLFDEFGYEEYIYIIDYLRPLSNLESIGYVLYTFHGDLFIVAGLILLVSMIGTILLTFIKFVDTSKIYISNFDFLYKLRLKFV